MEELRDRLLRAEETLRAIRSGEVDAFLVASERGPRVVMLEGTAHPYIALMERINEGAVTLGADGEILYCNRFLADDLVRLPREQLVGSSFRRLVVPEDRPDYDILLESGAAGGSRGALSLLRAPDGTHHQVMLSLSPTTPMLDDVGGLKPHGTGMIGIVTDLRDLKAAEQRLEARVLQQASIASLGQRALAAVSLDDVLADATHLVARTLGAAQCAVTELLPDGEGFRVRATAAPVARPHALLPVAEAPLSVLTLQSGRPVIVHDVHADERFAGQPGPLLRENASGIAVVIPDDGGPFGVLLAASPERHRFSGDDTDFLQSVANVLAAAIIRRRSEDLRRWLLEALTRSRDDERRRLSRELHDETRQSLWALVVGLNALETVPHLESVREAAQRLHVIAARTLDDIGRLARGLHPGALDDHGLIAAATQYLNDFTASYGIPVEQGVDLAPERLPPEVEITLYRILQEALTNVARHAQARSVRATLRREAETVELTVMDDGVGFRVEPVRSPRKSGGLGLHGMRERASMLGGDVIVASRPGAGTTVTARIPLQAAAR